MKTSLFIKDCSNSDLVSKIAAFGELLEGADAVLIDACAGLSAAAGLNYAGKKLKKSFQTLSISITLKTSILQASISFRQKKKDGHIGTSILTSYGLLL